jgi:hypothetical protein
MTAADAAIPFLVIAVFASTWTGVSVGGLQIVDICLVIATALVILDAVTGRRPITIPWWITVGGATVIVLAVVHVFFPTDASYMSTRFTVLINERLIEADGSAGSVLIALRWCVAIIALPVVTAYLAQTRPLLLRSIAGAFLAGAAVSSLVAVSDWTGLTQIGPGLIGGPSISGRQNGLASHVNSLAFGCVLAIPLGMYVFPYHRARTLLLLVVCIGGVFVSGSRGGQVATVVAFLASFFLLRSARKAIGWFIVAIFVAVGLISALAPQYFVLGATLLRFDTGAASDAGRSLVGEQAVLDFLTHPFFGVGLPIITHAHSVPLQLIASGGILLTLGFSIYCIGAFISGLRHRKLVDGASMAAAISVLLWVGQGVIQNQLVDRFLYVPIAIIAAVVLYARNAGVGSDELTPRTPRLRQSNRLERHRSASR